MKRAFYLLSCAALTLCACTSARLSSDQARKKIAEIGQSSLIPDAIEVRRIISQDDTRAIAEATVTLAFQFSRPNEHAEWRIEAVRLGDRDWISLDELLAAVNEGRRKTTSQSLQQLAEAVDKYRAANNGSLPNARDLVALTDVLHPSYMSVLIREDAWGHPIVYEVVGNSAFRLISAGADGRRGTSDDVIIEVAPGERPASP